MPPGMPRSRSFTRLTMRVGLLHLGQSVDLVVSIAFLRSPVLAILAIGRMFLLEDCLCSHAQVDCRRLQRRGPSAHGVWGPGGRLCPILFGKAAGLADSSLQQALEASSSVRLLRVERVRR